MKEVIKKEVCKNCVDDIAKYTKMENKQILAGADFVCEWCEEVVKKFQPKIQFFIKK